MIRVLINSSMSNSTSTDVINVSSHLRSMGRLKPFKRAVVYPSNRDRAGRVAYSHLTFLQLDQEADRIAHGLNSIGIVRGTRAVVMMKPSLEFFTVLFSLFRMGAVPIMADADLGVRRMLMCFEESGAEALIGTPIAHFYRKIYPKYFKSVHTAVTVGRRWFWGGQTLDQFRESDWLPYPSINTTRDETAVILFNPGVVGSKKGTVYSHGNLNAQIRHIKSSFGIESDEIDLPTISQFAMFDPALGMTAVIPDMDPAKPAEANPENIIEAIIDHGVTNLSASPSLLESVGRYGKANGAKLQSIRRVIIAGAPVFPRNIDIISSVLPVDTDIHTPYGAMEAPHITSMTTQEIISETKHLSEEGFGLCIGRPLDGIQVQIIKIDDKPIKTWSDDLLVPDGDIGELTAIGDLVSQQYYNRPEADRLSKIKDGDRIWHRMGDLGWKDNKGRLWYCGRKSQRVVTQKWTLYTIPCEIIFNNHSDVRRTALVGVGPEDKKMPVICIELEQSDKQIVTKEITEELLLIAEGYEHTKPIKTVLFHDGFPVDARHKTKILREQLTIWAEQQL
jgi:acyl-CoA synthetase (AMP-forming)/AMP-acid ligase II